MIDKLASGCPGTGTPRTLDRRELLRAGVAGFGYLAFAATAADAAARTAGPLAPKPPMLPARAKRVIFLCMKGGPSAMESFDHKPKLNAHHDKPSPTKGMKFFGCQWPFRQHGQSGLWISDLFPHLAGHADELCVLNGMHTDNPEHAAALE
ncbi:MAG: DUF1501 domain-containing protein, partial [Armatimonadetes bacterium]|nr:DUF1501 domain-containing protein [Armatimonadota bacterium]